MRPVKEYVNVVKKSVPYKVAELVYRHAKETLQEQNTYRVWKGYYPIGKCYKEVAARTRWGARLFARDILQEEGYDGPFCLRKVAIINPNFQSPRQVDPGKTIREKNK